MAVDSDGAASRRVISDLLTNEFLRAVHSHSWNTVAEIAERVFGVSLCISLMVRTPEEILKEAQDGK